MAGSLLPELTFRRLSVILVVLQLSHVAEARLMHSRAWAFYLFLNSLYNSLPAASVILSLIISDLTVYLNPLNSASAVCAASGYSFFIPSATMLNAAMTKTMSPAGINPTISCSSFTHTRVRSVESLKSSMPFAFINFFSNSL